jgi:hypothetical protein
MNVGLDLLDLERKLLQDVVGELDGGALVEPRVDAQHSQPGAVVDGGELVVLAVGAPAIGVMNFTSIWTWWPGSCFS